MSEDYGSLTVSDDDSEEDAQPHHYAHRQPTELQVGHELSLHDTHQAQQVCSMVHPMYGMVMLPSLLECRCLGCSIS